ncbi:MAG: hypothetical protein NZM06_06190 [Chloroherpetonaceae bacterium]|nr:hypothetical protein [Chloroherpetonaceae bacterium]
MLQIVLGFGNRHRHHWRRKERERLKVTAGFGASRKKMKIILPP